MALETDDLESQIAAAFDAEAAKGAEPPAPEPQKAAEPLADNPKDSAEDQEHKVKLDTEAAKEEARQRDEKGRFAKTEETGQDAAQVVTAPDAPGPEPTAQATLPPQALTPALKAQWAQLSPEVQAEFHRLESSFQTAKNEWAPKGQLLNALEAVFQPVDQRLALQGVTRQQYVSTLVAADELLRTNPLEGLRQVAQLYGVNLGQAFGPSPAQPYADPQQQVQQQAVPEWMPQLEQKFATLEERLAEIDRRETEAAEMTLKAQIDQFAADPENLYFPDVKADMARILAANVAPDLPTAYRMACYARDDIRPLIAAAEAAKAAQAAKPAQQQRGQPAGAQIIGGSPPGAGASASRAGLSLEEQVALAYDDSMGRA